MSDTISDRGVAFESRVKGCEGGSNQRAVGGWRIGRVQASEGEAALARGRARSLDAEDAIWDSDRGRPRKSFTGTRVASQFRTTSRVSQTKPSVTSAASLSFEQAWMTWAVALGSFNS